MKATAFILTFITLFSYGYGQDAETIIDQDGVTVQAKKSFCDLKMGYDQEWVLFTFENTNDYKVTLIWDVQMWLNGECKTCDDPHGEYHKVLELQPGESISGKCGVKEDNRFWLFSRFMDDNTDMNHELTDYKLANFTVVKMTKTD